MDELESNLARDVTAHGSVSGYSHAHEDNSVSHRTWLLSQSFNKKGDPALTLAVRSGQFQIVDFLLDCGVHINALNKDRETALDVALKKVLPCEGDILHYHFCSDFFPNAHQDEKEFRLSDGVKRMLERGAKGPSLHMVVLHLMKDEQKLREISDLIRDLTSEDNFRISGLLLQATVWFDQHVLLKDLLIKGVDPDNFWKAQFIPAIVPNTEYRRTVDVWERMSTDTEGDYILSQPEEVSIDSSTSLQSIKLAFVQDWRAEWFDGQNPGSQYKAGLLLTIDGASILIKAANHISILDQVVNDIMQYLPSMCGGPDLKSTPIIPYLVLAGYNFTIPQVMHLKLKYNLDFSPYLTYATTPKSLKQLSRLCIRSCVHTNVFFAVSRLKCLPTELQQFLLLNDIDNCVIEE